MEHLQCAYVVHFALYKVMPNHRVTHKIHKHPKRNKIVPIDMLIEKVNDMRMIPAPIKHLTDFISSQTGRWSVRVVRFQHHSRNGDQQHHFHRYSNLCFSSSIPRRLYSVATSSTT